MSYSELLDLLRNLILDVWATPWVKAILATIALNVFVAVFAAIKTGEYKWNKLGEFLWKKALPLVGTYAVFQLFGNAAGYDYISPAVFALLEITLLADLTDSLSKLGVNVPQSLRKDDCDCG